MGGNYMNVRHLILSVIIITFSQLAYAQIGGDDQLHIILPSGNTMAPKVGDQFAVGNIMFEYYRLDAMSLRVSENGRFELLVNDETDMVQLYDKGKKLGDFDSGSHYAFLKEDGLITAANNEITYFSLPKLKKAWSMDIDGEICGIDTNRSGKGLIYVGTKTGYVYCYDAKGILVKSARVFEKEQTTIMATASNKLVSVGMDSYVYEMKVLDFLDNKYESFTEQYDEAESPNAEEKYIQKMPIENRYGGTEYYSPLAYADLQKHVYFLLYLNAKYQILLYDSQNNEIISNDSIQPNGVVAGFTGNNLIIADFLNNKVTILNMKLEVIDSFAYEFGSMPNAYNISSISYIGGKAKLTFSKTNKYWK
jgi:hypothetical protein